MRYVYREVDGKVESFLVSTKTRLPNQQNERFGENVPFHRRILNAYSDLESTGQLTGAMTKSRSKTFVRDVHEKALAEGF